MLYDSLKILHIISATLMLTSIIYSYHLWKNNRRQTQMNATVQRIQQQTWLFILPFALIQLGTGFTMISIQHYDFSEWWVSGSLIGFIIVIGSWFSFVYFLLLSEQLIGNTSQLTTQLEAKYYFFRRIQSMMLLLCASALLSMIFFMSNKTVSLYG